MGNSFTKARDQSKKVETSKKEIDSKIEEIDSKIEEIDSKIEEINSKIEEIDLRLRKINSQEESQPKSRPRAQMLRLSPEDQKTFEENYKTYPSKGKTEHFLKEMEKKEGPATRPQSATATKTNQPQTNHLTS